MTREELDRLWAAPENWGLVYQCAQDPRVIVPRRQRWMGWTINFAHPQATLVIVLSALLMVGPVLLMLYLRMFSPLFLPLVMLASVAVLVGLSHWEATRSRD